MFGYFLIICFLLYGAFAYVSFSPMLRLSPFFYVYGLSCALAGNALWLYLAKKTLDTTKLLFYGMIWDATILASFIIVPFLFFDAALTAKEWVSFLLILAGIILLKV